MGSGRIDTRGSSEDVGTSVALPHTLRVMEKDRLEQPRKRDGECTDLGRACTVIYLHWLSVAKDRFCK